MNSENIFSVTRILTFHITSRIYDYLDGLVSKADFLNELKYHEPTHQICLCTVHSLQVISNPSREIISKIEKIAERVIFELVEKEKLSELEATEWFYNSNRLCCNGIVKEGL